MHYESLIYSLLTGISICIYVTDERVWYENPLLYGFAVTALILFAWYAYQDRPAVLGILSVINIGCILLDHYFENRIGSGVLLLAGSTLYFLFVIFSYNSTDESCTEEFKKLSWKNLLLDLSVLNVIAFGIFLLTDVDFAAYAILQVIHAIYIVVINMNDVKVHLPLGRNRKSNLTLNQEQQSLFGINDDDV